MGKTTVQMRPEARPLRLEDLDYYQKEAIEKISAVLLEALGHVKSASRKGVPKSDLDTDRANRLFFLSGEAGGGKTTVYLSLRKALEEEAEAPPAGFPDLEDLQGERRKLIWLEPLDLESAPEVHNFLAATLVRIERALSEKDGDNQQGRNRRRGVLEDASHGAHQDFDKLRNDVVLAWEGNLRERAEHIEPEIYSLEVIRSAEASLRINARFREALEGMMKENERYRESLFILPVDDFYLNPSSSLELLRLLRMISIPRLFVLVLGNFYVIEELLYQNMLGKLVRQAGEHALRYIQRQGETLTAAATELTAHYFRKLIPPAQRYQLEVMHQLGALEFHPSRLDPALCKGQTEGDGKTLMELLEQLPVKLEDVGNCHGTLFQFICLRGLDKEKDNEYTYSGLAILDLPPREVVDLWYSVNNTLPDPTWEATLGIIIDAAVAAISGQNYISKEAQDLCSFAIKGNRSNEKSFDTSYLSVSPDLAPWLRIPLEDEVVLEVSAHKGWFFYPSMVVDSASMAPRPTAWLTVLHDLMALSGEDRLIGEVLTPGSFDFGLVRVKQGHRQRAWPAPRWISFWHFDRLSFAWRKVQEAKRRKKSTNSIELIQWLAFHWLRYIVDILLLNGNELMALPGETVTEEEWKDLGRDLTNLWSPENTDREASKSKLIEDWLMCLAVVFTPDLNSHFGNAVQPFWGSRSREIQAIRKKLDETPAS